MTQIIFETRPVLELPQLESAVVAVEGYTNGPAMAAGVPNRDETPVNHDVLGDQSVVFPLVALDEVLVFGSSSDHEMACVKERGTELKRGPEPQKRSEPEPRLAFHRLTN